MSLILTRSIPPGDRANATVLLVAEPLAAGQGQNYQKNPPARPYWPGGADRRRHPLTMP